MRRTVLGLLAGVVIVQAAPAATVGSGPAASADAEQQLRRVERERIAAEISRDVPTLRRILDDGFVATFGAGEAVAKEEYISQLIGDHTDTMLSQDLSDETLHVDRDTAVIVETDTIRGTDGGTPYTRTFRVTATYIKRHGQWRALAEHLAALRPPANPAAEETAIRKLDTEWLVAAQSRGADAWVAYYADDVALMAPNEGVVTGKSGVRKRIGELLALPGLSISWFPARIEVARSGELAYLAGTYTLAFDDPKGRQLRDHGKLLEIWRKQPDGSWKCVIDTWNSDLPAPGS